MHADMSMMAEAIGKVLDWVGCLGGGERRSTWHYYYNYYAPSSMTRTMKMGKGRPLALQVIELKVRMCCEGCERVVKHALHKLRGVDSVEVNLPLGKVTVTGYIDRNKVLKQVRRSGKKVEFWPNPDLPLFFTNATNYFHDEQSYRDSYNYWRHGYNNSDKHGNLPVNRRGEDPVSNLFNDDDVNACSIM
ncbi:heavy metal-associated isoprenylated plant protein 30-like [Phalaenopsis equestris]|uniref:heavy metal-associated isoprenylated plant protein 30-like n=1 Tax=Phalaenopsis equestris TaxID=78828 RepID=UPI0009E630FA|nr:heavy metal-associated isoprenylated plant protein 30-like [Phalaenopsis equestris]